MVADEEEVVQVHPDHSEAGIAIKRRLENEVHQEDVSEDFRGYARNVYDSILRAIQLDDFGLPFCNPLVQNKDRVDAER